jgi:hypothetical protein
MIKILSMNSAKRHRAVRLVFIYRRKEVLQMNIRANHTVILQVAPKDSKGNTTSLDSAAVPAWLVDDATKGSVAVVPNSLGLQAVFTPTGALGACNVIVRVPAVNAEPDLQQQLALTVVPGDVASLLLVGAEQ